MTLAQLFTSCLLLPLLASISWASAMPAPAAADIVKELAAMERRGVDLEHMSLKEVQRDSDEAKRAYVLRSQLTPAAMPLLLEAALACQRSKTFRLLLDVLADLGPPEVPAPLLKMATDPKVDVVLRRQLPHFIGRIGNASHVALLETLSTDTDFKVANQAVFGLGALPGRAGVPAIYRILDGKKPYPRSAAAEVLGEIDEYPSVQKLIDCLLDNDSYVRTFAQASLTEMTYRFSVDRPLQAREQHKHWQDWWDARKQKPREALLAEALAENLAALADKDLRAAFQHVCWLAELSFQSAPEEIAFTGPLGPVLQGIELARWKQWIQAHGKDGRVEWFRQAVDSAVAQLANTEPAASWPGLSQLSELIALPAGEPYLFRAIWVRESLAERQRLAAIYRDWWKANRATFVPLGKKYW